MTTPLFALRLNEELQNEVKRLAKETGKTKSDVVRELVIKALQAQPAPTKVQPVNG